MATEAVKITWTNTPWALNGAQTPSSLARLAQYVALGGAEGIAQLGDLKVLPLTTPGNGIRVSSGGAALLNRYISNPDQTYMVSNPTEDVLGPTDMPASNASARSHLVCVTIGDPQYSQAGHPWMLGTDPPSGQANTFRYVRTFVIQNVPSTTTRFDQLGLSYPGLALARIDLPGSTTTVQSSHIVDLRKMARPRDSEVIWHVFATAADTLSTSIGVYEYFPDGSQKAVDIPTWASYAYIDGYVEGLKILADCNAKFRVGSTGAGIFTVDSHLAHNFQSGFINRRSINVGGLLYIPAAYRGTTQNFQISAAPVEGLGASVTTDAWTTAQVSLRFREVPD